MQAAKIAAHLNGCNFVVIPFAGGMSIVPHLTARTKLVSDLHRHVVNLARVVSEKSLCAELICRLEQLAFHPDELSRCQKFCKLVEQSSANGLFSGTGEDAVDAIDWAEAFFVSTWMIRGGVGGTKSEFDTALSVRYDAGGGGSNTRYRSAVEGLEEWQQAMVGCDFVCEDFRALMSKTKDAKGIGYYVDAPWCGAGDAYKFSFTRQDHIDLARLNNWSEHARVVVRYGDDPLIRELYPADKWTWHEYASRSQANGDVSEVLLVRR